MSLERSTKTHDASRITRTCKEDPLSLKKVLREEASFIVRIRLCGAFRNPWLSALGHSHDPRYPNCGSVEIIYHALLETSMCSPP